MKLRRVMSSRRLDRDVRTCSSASLQGCAVRQARRPAVVADEGEGEAEGGGRGRGPVVQGRRRAPRRWRRAVTCADADRRPVILHSTSSIRGIRHNPPKWSLRSNLNYNTLEAYLDNAAIFFFIQVSLVYVILKTCIPVFRCRQYWSRWFDSDNWFVYVSTCFRLLHVARSPLFYSVLETSL